MQPHATKRDFEAALAGVVFPASRSEIWKRARDTGGLDREVHDILSALSQDSYDTLEALIAELRDIYRARGVPDDALPV
jgi:hypothetical protein